jgi:hypothetical protein
MRHIERRLSVRCLCAAVLAVLSILTSAPAGAEPQCTDVGLGATRCGGPGSVQISVTPAPLNPYIRYGCTAGFTSACDIGFRGPN